ncbi:MAG: LysR family transcriptional regulator [Lachnospiraceae bacterium]|nr:LysR family transcriptional regulator [Lachnospiraceae bacterium]
MIETYLLEQLLAFSKAGTLSAAAESLYISQPALSRSMKKLEDVLGVPLFVRQKNRITLNENGEEAAKYAERILTQEEEMIRQLRMLEKRNHTIALGSCAPVPNYILPPILSRLYPEMTISQSISDEEKLVSGLKDGSLQLIVLHQKPVEDNVVYVPCGTEKLFICLPPDNPLSKKTEGVYLSELDGLNILLYSQIGFWYDLCREKSPGIRFLKQNDWESFGQLVDASTLPVFGSDYFFRLPMPENAPKRVVIPLLDEETFVTYYLTCLQSSYARFKPFFREVEGLSVDAPPLP